MPLNAKIVVIVLIILLAISILIFCCATLWQERNLIMTDELNKSDKNKDQRTTIWVINIFGILTSILIILLAIYLLYSEYTGTGADAENVLSDGQRIQQLSRDREGIIEERKEEERKEEERKEEERKEEKERRRMYERGRYETYQNWPKSLKPISVQNVGREVNGVDSLGTDSVRRKGTDSVRRKGTDDARREGTDTVRPERTNSVRRERTNTVGRERTNTVGRERTNVGREENDEFDTVESLESAEQGGRYSDNDTYSVNTSKTEPIYGQYNTPEDNLMTRSHSDIPGRYNDRENSGYINRSTPILSGARNSESRAAIPIIARNSESRSRSRNFESYGHNIAEPIQPIARNSGSGASGYGGYEDDRNIKTPSRKLTFGSGVSGYRNDNQNQSRVRYRFKPGRSRGG